MTGDNNNDIRPMIIDDKYDINSTFNSEGALDFCEDITSRNVPEKIEDIELQIDRLKRKWNEVTYLIGQRLKHINEKRLYEAKGYHDFSSYVRIALKMSDNNAYYYIAIYDLFTEEQTRAAGSKLKLIIPILNNIKRDKKISDTQKTERIRSIRNELVNKVTNKTYREAEKVIKEIRNKYFTGLKKMKEDKKVVRRKDKIIIYESDPVIQEKLINLVNDFYNS